MQYIYKYNLEAKNKKGEKIREEKEQLQHKTKVKQSSDNILPAGTLVTIHW